MVNDSRNQPRVYWIPQTNEKAAAHIPFDIFENGHTRFHQKLGVQCIGERRFRQRSEKRLQGAGNYIHVCVFVNCHSGKLSCPSLAGRELLGYDGYTLKPHG